MKRCGKGPTPGDPVTLELARIDTVAVLQSAERLVEALLRRLLEGDLSTPAALANLT